MTISWMPGALVLPPLEISVPYLVMAMPRINNDEFKDSFNAIRRVNR